MGLLEFIGWACITAGAYLSHQYGVGLMLIGLYFLIRHHLIDIEVKIQPPDLAALLAENRPFFDDRDPDPFEMLFYGIETSSAEELTGRVLDIRQLLNDAKISANYRTYLEYELQRALFRNKLRARTMAKVSSANG